MSLREVTVHTLIDEIAKDMCDNYCKYPQIVHEKFLQGEVEECDKSDYLAEHYCNNCPLTEKL